jgi:Fibronectin type III domain
VVAGATAVSAAPVLTATAGLAVVNLSWTVPFDGGSAITGYAIYRGTTSGGETLLASVAPGTTYADASVTSGITYYYRVLATNADGDGATSNEVSATPA